MAQIVPDLHYQSLQNMESIFHILRGHNRIVEQSLVRRKHSLEICSSTEVETASAMWQFTSEMDRLYMQVMRRLVLSFQMHFTGHQSVFRMSLETNKKTTLQYIRTMLH